jgi:16S rRNA (guanine527-N7)-methyltransferase
VIADEAQAKAWLRRLPEWDDAAGERLECLVRMLAEENARQNLVSAASLAEVWRRHVADSAQLLLHVPRGTSPWLDLGTGAGFPGLVVAALRPACTVVLVESRKRRVEWLERARDALGLANVAVAGQRVENVSNFSAGAVSARAFAPLDRLLALSARFSTSDTIWVLPKGRSAQQELDMLRGWIHTFHVEQSLTEASAGVIVGRLTGRSRPSGKGKDA